MDRRGIKAGTLINNGIMSMENEKKNEIKRLKTDL